MDPNISTVKVLPYWLEGQLDKLGDTVPPSLLHDNLHTLKTTRQCSHGPP
jgi:hypothetical protein